LAIRCINARVAEVAGRRSHHLLLFLDSCRRPALSPRPLCFLSRRPALSNSVPYLYRWYEIRAVSCFCLCHVRSHYAGTQRQNYICPTIRQGIRGLYPLPPIYQYPWGCDISTGERALPTNFRRGSILYSCIRRLSLLCTSPCLY
jgi:hypothetical protein